MIKFKKANSQNFFLSENKKSIKHGFNRASSMKPIKDPEIKTLRDFINKRLQNCLIVDQINAMKPTLPKQKTSFILKTKSLSKQNIFFKENKKNVEISTKKDINNELLLMKAKKPKVVKQKNKTKKKNHKNHIKIEDFGVTATQKKEESLHKEFAALIIKQKGLAD